MQTTSGRPTAAILIDPQAVVDHKAYWIPCETMEEAHYLAAVINSHTAWQAVIPITTKNWAGDTRDLHKHLWRLSIPAYDPSSTLHREIATAGEKAANGAAEVLRQVQASRAADRKTTSITVVRREIRAWLETSHEGQDLEQAVRRLLA